MQWREFKLDRAFGMPLPSGLGYAGGPSLHENAFEWEHVRQRVEAELLYIGRWLRGKANVLILM